MVCGHCLATLPLTINETLKCLSSCRCPSSCRSLCGGDSVADRYIISLVSHLYTPSPTLFSPSLISFIVSVDAKPLKVNLLTRVQDAELGAVWTVRWAWALVPYPILPWSVISLNASADVKCHERRKPCDKAQELCESRGGRSGLPVPNSPYGLCGRKAALNLDDSFSNLAIFCP